MIQVNRIYLIFNSVHFLVDSSGVGYEVNSVVHRHAEHHRYYAGRHHIKVCPYIPCSRPHTMPGIYWGLVR